MLYCKMINLNDYENSFDIFVMILWHWRCTVVCFTIGHWVLNVCHLVVISDIFVIPLSTVVYRSRKDNNMPFFIKLTIQGGEGRSPFSDPITMQALIKLTIQGGEGWSQISDPTTMQAYYCCLSLLMFAICFFVQQAMGDDSPPQDYSLDFSFNPRP